MTTTLSTAPSSPRCAALVGPYLSGKTSLLESLLFSTGTISRKGKVEDGTTVGDTSPEARARTMSTEPNIVATEFLGEAWTVIDCPGSVEFQQDARHALMVCDMAVVVCEPVIEKAMMVAPILKFLDDYEIPHLLFINKMDHARDVRIRDLLSALQAASDRPLVLRQVPIRKDDQITGYVDLASERAYEYKPGAASSLIQIPSDVADREVEARREMLESLADFDDGLLEQLLEDAVPARDDIYKYLTDTLQSDKIVPVFIGSAEKDHGVRRLWKAMRHEGPGPAQAASRLEIDTDTGVCASVFKTIYLPHTGKVSVVRIWEGQIKDGQVLNGERVSGMSRVEGGQQAKLTTARVGDVVALGRMDGAKTGDVLSDRDGGMSRIWPLAPMPLYALAIGVEKSEDDVKLSASIHKLIEEDPSYRIDHDPDTHEMLLAGQGEIHLQVAIDRLKNKYNLTVSSWLPQVPYKETIRKPTSQHARHKKQSGGHGQFGDVHIDIKPLPRGTGFEFNNKIVGGRVPRQYIPAVEHGVREYMHRGPLGFPVVDVAVTLTDGQHHAVDSSDMAFKTAGSMAMREGMPKCEPVLLEPVFDVKIAAPSGFTSNIQGLISGRRGQIVMFDAKPGWNGWDEVHAKLPQSQIQDLIIELRSLTQGVGTFEYSYDHLQEVTGRVAEEVVASHQSAPHSG